MTLRLRTGQTTVRRDDRHLQVGIDPPHLVVVPDTPAVRRAARELEVGRGLTTTDLSDPAVARFLHQLREADLISDDPRPLPAQPVGPQDLVDSLSGLTPLDQSAGAPIVLMSAGPLRRELIDPLIRDSTPHLVIAGGPDGWTVGPYVVPGVTACLRCLDAEHGRRDPRRALVIEQYARTTSGDGDPVGRSLALAYAVNELRLLARGARPTTWSAVVAMVPGPLTPRHIRRHPECGCAWDLALAT